MASGTTSAATTSLIARQNPTGYSQRLVCMVGDTQLNILGDDVLFQWTPGNTHSLAYDGQGTTRQLLGPAGVSQTFYADAYGQQRAEGVGTAPSAAATAFLYTGEARDPATGWTYLRARFLDNSTGTFNREDPFFGNLDDPQSLHKYAYVHGDPVNSWDPTGYSQLSSVLVTGSIIAGLVSSIISVLGSVVSRTATGKPITFRSVIGAAVGGFIGGAASVLLPVILTPILGMFVAGMLAAAAELLITQEYTNSFQLIAGLIIGGALNLLSPIYGAIRRTSKHGTLTSVSEIIAENQVAVEQLGRAINASAKRWITKRGLEKQYSQRWNQVTAEEFVFSSSDFAGFITRLDQRAWDILNRVAVQLKQMFTEELLELPRVIVTGAANDQIFTPGASGALEWIGLLVSSFWEVWNEVDWVPYD